MKAVHAGQLALAFDAERASNSPNAPPWRARKTARPSPAAMHDAPSEPVAAIMAVTAHGDSVPPTKRAARGAKPHPTPIDTHPEILSGFGIFTGRVKNHAPAKPKRSKKPKPARVLIAVDAIILAVDPGKSSGWALYDRGMLQAFGQCDPYSDEPRKLLEEAARMGERAVLVIERPVHRRFGSGGYDTTNVGAADTVWREHAKRCGYAKRIVRVYPASWRAKVLGAPWHMAKRKLVREHEQQVVRSMLAKDWAAVPGDDACPAILIGQWAAHAGEVAKVLPRAGSGQHAERPSSLSRANLLR